MSLSVLTQALLAALQKKNTPADSANEKIIISRTVSAFAFLYERLRSAVEYREEHLLRRGAIERILKRRLMLNENGRGIAENLLKEILWAKYLPYDSLPVAKIAEVQRIIDKYIFFRNEICRGRSQEEKNKLREWLISSAACEIEENIVASDQREAFVNFIFQYFQSKILLKDETDEVKNAQVYIAVHQAFARSNDDLIRYELLKLRFPDLLQSNWQVWADRIPVLYETLKTIDAQLHHKLRSKISRYLKREMPPFLILRDLYNSDPVGFPEILADHNRFQEKIDVICRQRYEEIRSKLGRAGTRSIVYIFLTKMVFAFALEYPFDKYILQRVDYIPLAINTFFPPFIMFLVVFGITPPGDDNTKRILKRITEIIYSEADSTQKITIALKTPQRKPVLLFIFSLFYMATFLLTFGVIVFMLNFLHFSLASQIVFLFFLSVVLFFGYRVRQTGKDYVLRDRESLFAPLADFFVLPILNVGKILSQEIARLNFLVAIFDFVIEAPFKAIFEIVEEWFSFIRRKKEEII